MASKQAQARSIIAQINSIETNLSVAVERWNLANVKLARISHDLQRSRYELGVARVNLERAQTALSRQALDVYTSSESNSLLEVLFGASNLDDLINRIDTVNRVNDQRTSLVGDVKTFQRTVKRQAALLRRSQMEQKRIVAQRAAEKRSIEGQLAQRNRLLAFVRGEIAHLQAVEHSRQLALARQWKGRIGLRPPAFGSGFGIGASTAEENIVPSSQYSGVVGVAMRYLGIPYVWGGSSPSGFDCSGFVMYVYAQMGVSLPHSSYAQYGVGVPVSSDQLQPGDLVFFDGLGHEGIYIGGGQFVHSPHTGDVVKISPLSGWYASTYVGARRIL